MVELVGIPQGYGLGRGNGDSQVLLVRYRVPATWDLRESAPAWHQAPRSSIAHLCHENFSLVVMRPELTGQRQCPA